jgi:hypothetical protein
MRHDDYSTIAGASSIILLERLLVAGSVKGRMANRLQMWCVVGGRASELHGS